MSSPSDETPLTGADNREESKVEVKSIESPEKQEEIRNKLFAKRSKSFGSLIDANSLSSHRRLSRRKTVDEGNIVTGGSGGIRVVWRTSPAVELKNLSRILGIPARHRSVSPMKNPETVDHVFSEYYNPLAFYARASSNSQGETSHIDNPKAKKRNTQKKDSVTMPSVKKLLSIFERSATTVNDTRNPTLESKALPLKEHHIKFPKADKNKSLNHNISGIANNVYGQYRPKDFSEVNNDNSAFSQKSEKSVAETFSKNESTSWSENNNASNLGNFNNIHKQKESISAFAPEVSPRKIDSHLYLEANKVSKPTTSVSFLKQKWESFVNERMKAKKVSKPVNLIESDVPIVLGFKQSASKKTSEPSDKKVYQPQADTFRKTPAPFERNTTGRRSVKNIAKKYESMRESSANSKEDKDKKIAAEGWKKIPLTPSKSLDNIRSKLFEKMEEPWLIDIGPQVKEFSEVEKESIVSKVNTPLPEGLERKPSVRDLKKKFEVIQNEDQIGNQNIMKKAELVLRLSAIKQKESESGKLNNGLEELTAQAEENTFPVDGQVIIEPTIIQERDNFHEKVIKDKDTSLHIYEAESDIPSDEKNLLDDHIKSIENELKLNTELSGFKSVTKQSSIKIELMLSPPNPLKKSKLSVKPISTSLINANRVPTINTKVSQSEHAEAVIKPTISTEIKAKTYAKIAKLDTPKLISSKRDNVQAEKENFDVSSSEASDFRLMEDTKLLQSEINLVESGNFDNKLNVVVSPTLYSDPKSVKTVLVTEFRSPYQKNFIAPNVIEVSKRKETKLSEIESEDLAEYNNNSTIDTSMTTIQTSKTKELTTITRGISPKSESKLHEIWEDNPSSKHNEVKDKTSKNDSKVAMATENKMTVLQSEENLNNHFKQIKDLGVDKELTKEIMETGLECGYPLLNQNILGEPNKNFLYNSSYSKDDISETKATTIAAHTKEKGASQQRQIGFHADRTQSPATIDRTIYIVNQANVSESCNNSSSDSKFRSTADTTDKKAINCERDPKNDACNNANENAISDAINLIGRLNGATSEESLTKGPAKGGLKYRNKKAARRSYTDSFVKDLIKSEASYKLEVRKEPEIAHPNELYNLIYRKNLQDSSQEVQSSESAANKIVPPLLAKKTRSKSITSMTFFNKVRELKPDELKFFKKLTPLAAYPNNTLISKDRASSIATSSPTSEAQSPLERKDSFERSSMRDSKKYRYLHSDEMKFFGLNNTVQ